jgi:hypothetical protein
MHIPNHAHIVQKSDIKITLSISLILFPLWSLRTSALLLSFRDPFLYSCFSLSPSVLASEWCCVLFSSLV